MERRRHAQRATVPSSQLRLFIQILVLFYAEYVHLCSSFHLPIRQSRPLSIHPDRHLLDGEKFRLHTFQKDETDSKSMGGEASSSPYEDEYARQLRQYLEDQEPPVPYSSSSYGEEGYATTAATFDTYVDDSSEYSYETTTYEENPFRPQKPTNELKLQGPEVWDTFRSLTQTGSPDPQPGDEKIWSNSSYSPQALIDSFVNAQIKMSENEDSSLDWENIWNSYRERQQNFLDSKTSDLQARSARAFQSTYNRRKLNQNNDDATGMNTKGMTERIMRRIPLENQATGAGGASSWDAFRRAETSWATLRNLFPNKLVKYEPEEIVVENDSTKGNPQCWTKLQRQANSELDYDVVVCGGTLGIFFATALLLKGHRVAVLESGKLRGREQEWNISLDELMELVELGVLTEEDVESAITTEFAGCRSGFKNREVTPLDGGYFENGIGYECFTENVLNLGVSPSILLDRVAAKFQMMGGDIYEETPMQRVAVWSSVGSAIDVGEQWEPITSRLVIDCMGNSSPITRQSRFGMKPDGVCAVVGSCASGFDPSTNIIGDIIYTNTEIKDNGKNGKNQYFWEAFPVNIGRNGAEPGSSSVKTTYMFTYMDANQKRPSLESLMEDYWKLLPIYQPSIKNPETDLNFRRVLFAFFPTYRDSPLKPEWDRIIAVGDASGIQSPLSFGGFGALTRHLGRVSGAISEALDRDLLDKENLGEINPYTPNLSAAWMFQKAMSVRMGQKIHPKFMNRLLATNFEVMNEMGPDTIRPFLQDVIRFDGLVGSLARSFMADPSFMPQIVSHVGIPTLFEWLQHVSAMGAYAFLDNFFAPWGGPIVDATLRDKERNFKWRRTLEAWKYGSGNDYTL